MNRPEKTSVSKVQTSSSSRGVVRIFQRGVHTVSNIIVVAFSPRNIVGCLLKKGLQRGWGGGGVTGTREAPRYALEQLRDRHNSRITFETKLEAVLRIRKTI